MVKESNGKSGKAAAKQSASKKSAKGKERALTSGQTPEPQSGPSGTTGAEGASLGVTDAVEGGGTRSGEQETMGSGEEVVPDVRRGSQDEGDGDGSDDSEYVERPGSSAIGAVAPRKRGRRTAGRGQSTRGKKRARGNRRAANPPEEAEAEATEDEGDDQPAASNKPFLGNATKSVQDIIAGWTKGEGTLEGVPQSAANSLIGAMTVGVSSERLRLEERWHQENLAERQRATDASLASSQTQLLVGSILMQLLPDEAKAQLEPLVKDCKGTLDDLQRK